MRWFLSAAVILSVTAVLMAGFSSGVTLAAANQPTWVPSYVRLSADELTAATTTIDTLVNAGLARQNLTPNPPIDDLAFLRRSSLDLIGRIPNADEIAAFQADHATDRRTRLIDRLIAHPGHALHRFGFYADVLRVQNSLQGRISGATYISWLMEQSRRDRPWDQLTRDLLTASGSAFVSGNGATGFWLRDRGMPLDRVAHEAQVFIGTRIGCAQCHDHPYDNFSRKQYYQLAANTAGTRIQERVKGTREEQSLARKKIEKETPEVRNTFRQLNALFGSEVQGPNQAQLVLSDDYQYPDARPGQMMPAGVPWGERTTGPRDARISYAEWMTAPANPRFTVVMAGRLWNRLMGYGLTESIDGWTDITVPGDPALMEFLNRLLISVDWDLDRFEAILCRSESYRRGAVVTGSGIHRPGPVVRRLSAEQIWDSYVALVVTDPEQGPDNDPSSRLNAYVSEHIGDKPEDVLVETKRVLDLRRRAQEINQQLRELRGPKGDREKSEALRTELQNITDMGEVIRGARGRNAKANGIERAAYLPQPAPLSHPLRILGQSDRELIDNGSTVSNVTQALLILNGLADRGIVNRKDSALMKAVTAAPGTEARITTLWQNVLTREPTATERARAVAHLVADPNFGLQDLTWSLFASTEFVMRP